MLIHFKVCGFREKKINPWDVIGAFVSLGFPDKGKKTIGPILFTAKLHINILDENLYFNGFSTTRLPIFS